MLTFVFVFPIVTMLIIGGVVRHRPDPAFAGKPVALVRRVLPHGRDRRDRPDHAAGAPGRPTASAACCAGSPPPASRDGPSRSPSSSIGLVTIAVAGALLLAVAAPVYGVPAVHDGVAGRRRRSWLGSVAFVSIGVLLGTLLPSARSAQAVGLILFFPSFLLGAGGPPPRVMGSALRTSPTCCR